MATPAEADVMFDIKRKYMLQHVEMAKSDENGYGRARKESWAWGRSPGFVKWDRDNTCYAGRDTVPEAFGGLSVCRMTNSSNGNQYTAPNSDVETRGVDTFNCDGSIAWALPRNKKTNIHIGFIAADLKDHASNRRAVCLVLNIRHSAATVYTDDHYMRMYVDPNYDKGPRVNLYHPQDFHKMFPPPPPPSVQVVDVQVVSGVPVPGSSIQENPLKKRAREEASSTLNRKTEELHNNEKMQYLKGIRSKQAKVEKTKNIVDNHPALVASHESEIKALTKVFEEKLAGKMALLAQRNKELTDAKQALPEMQESLDMEKYKVEYIEEQEKKAMASLDL